jgi:hypothetical protein
MRAPVAVGLRGVHASWIEHALSELPARARRALAEGPRDAVDVWLVRWACSELPALPATSDRAVLRVEDLISVPNDALAAWLERVGHGQLAYAASLARPGAARRDELGPARGVIARCRGGDPVAIAARALAPHVIAHAAAPRQLAVKLPRDRGLLLERELAAHAGEPLADVPTWPALVALGNGAG